MQPTNSPGRATTCMPLNRQRRQDDPKPPTFVNVMIDSTKRDKKLLNKTFTYYEVYSIIEKTDQDPYDTTNVVLLYTGRSMNRNYKDHGGRYEYKMHGYTYQDAWNRISRNSLPAMPAR